MYYLWCWGNPVTVLVKKKLHGPFYMIMNYSKQYVKQRAG